ncbi:MAG: TetR/AcrR family transcriptional regulator [Vibrio sp.]
MKKKKFNDNNVIDKATKLFWLKGFHATSMRDIQEVTDMRPGSLYATFGSKDELFKRSLIRYHQHGVDLLDKCYHSSSSPLSGLKEFLNIFFSLNSNKAPSNVCLLVKTVTELSEENHQLLEYSKKLLLDMQTRFEKIFEEAQVKGEVTTSLTAKNLAIYFQMQFMGLRILKELNSGNDHQISWIINEMLDKYPFNCK